MELSIIDIITYTFLLLVFLIPIGFGIYKYIIYRKRIYLVNKKRISKNKKPWKPKPNKIDDSYYQEYEKPDSSVNDILNIGISIANIAINKYNHNYIYHHHNTNDNDSLNDNDPFNGNGGKFGGGGASGDW